MLCNREIKFAHFLRFAQDRLQAPLIATGHYARLHHGGEAWVASGGDVAKEKGEEGPELLAGGDKGKDQSYFLSHVPTAAFRRVLFPLGGLRKAEVGGCSASEGSEGGKGEAGLVSVGPPPLRPSVRPTPSLSLSVCACMRPRSCKQVRWLAREAGLCTAAKRESMGICFVGKRR